MPLVMRKPTVLRTDGYTYGNEGTGSPPLKLPALRQAPLPWHKISLGQKEIPLLPKRTEKCQVLGQQQQQQSGSPFRMKANTRVHES